MAEGAGDMADTFTKPETPRHLSDLLTDGRPCRVKESLLLVHRLALQARVLHQKGRTHRAICPEQVIVDEKRRPPLGPPAGPRRFGGKESDPEFAPPDRAEGDGLELPESIEAAAAVLRKAGHTLDPRRIDVYQLGTLLCRLLTGGSIQAYIFDPMTKAKVPAIVRPMLSRALGFDPGNRCADCNGLIEALDEALPQAGSVETPTSMHETPAGGSVILPDGDTPPEGNEPASAPQAADLPFERLGHYRILARVGSGGMGDGYRGYDESLDRQ